MNTGSTSRRFAAIAASFVTGVVACIVVATADSPAADAYAVVRAQRIELIDERGNQRARFSVEPGGEVVLRLLSASGEIRVKLGASNDGSGFILMDGATEPAIHMTAESGRTQVRVKDGSGQEVLDP